MLGFWIWASPSLGFRVCLRCQGFKLLGLRLSGSQKARVIEFRALEV